MLLHIWGSPRTCPWIAGMVNLTGYNLLRCHNLIIWLRPQCLAWHRPRLTPSSLWDRVSVLLLEMAEKIPSHVHVQFFWSSSFLGVCMWSSQHTLPCACPCDCILRELCSQPGQHGEFPRERWYKTSRQEGVLAVAEVAESWHVDKKINYVVACNFVEWLFL